MSDFEVVERGTITELQLARNLARAIEEITFQYNRVLPYSVMVAYNKLKEHYESQDRSV